MRKFFVDGRKLATIECDIDINVCPVAQFARDIRATHVIDAANSSIDIQKTTIAEKYCHASALAEHVMNTCLECSVKVR